MRAKILAIITAALAITTLSGTGQALAADGQRLPVSTSCGTKHLVTVNDDGTSLSQQEIAGITSLIKASCTKATIQPRSVEAASGEGVSAEIKYSGVPMTGKSWAWGQPYGTKKPLRFLSCAYWQVGAGDYHGCGYTQLTTNGFTPTFEFCPLKGTTWEVYAGVVNSRGDIFESANDFATALP